MLEEYMLDSSPCSALQHLSTYRQPFHQSQRLGSTWYTMGWYALTRFQLQSDIYVLLQLGIARDVNGDLLPA